MTTASEPSATGSASSHRRRSRLAVALLLALAQATAGAVTASAETVRAAVATNFAEPMSRIAALFKQRTGHDVVVSTGATGALYAQTRAAAPYHVFLSADAERPAAMEREGLGVAGTRFTYAIGVLALWSADPNRITGDGPRALQASDVRALAIAEPALAPYGAAAKETLQKLGHWEALQGRLVFGKNIGQTHALVATGNAELGFVALSSLKGNPARGTGSVWEVPGSLHAPIRQDAILLTSAAANDAARAFLEFLKGPEAREVIAASGYRQAE